MSSSHSHLDVATHLRRTVGVALLLLPFVTGCGLLDSITGGEQDGTQPAAEDVAAAPPPASKPATQTPGAQRPGQPALAKAQPQRSSTKPGTANAGDEPATPKAAMDRADVDDATEEPKKRKRRASNDEDEGDEPKRKERDLDADLSVKRLVIAKSVKGREPVGAGAKFSANQGRIYAFVEVGNRDQVPSEIYVSFIEKKTGRSQRVPLKVGAGSRWRTWVYTRNATKPGTWHAVVKNAKGKTLASQAFEITGKAKDADKGKDAKKPKKKDDGKKAKSDKPKANKKSSKPKAKKADKKSSKSKAKKADKSSAEKKKSSKK